jgi:hypothetical protein
VKACVTVNIISDGKALACEKRCFIGSTYTAGDRRSAVTVRGICAAFGFSGKAGSVIVQSSY